MLHLLKSLDYTTAEFLLTPLQFGIPNSRLRYYLLAKRRPFSFVDNEEGKVRRHLPGFGVDWVDPRTEGDASLLTSVESIQCYVDLDTPFEEFRIPDRVLEKWGRLFDIVLPSGKRTCCFTRGKIGMSFFSHSLISLQDIRNSQNARVLSYN